MDLKNKEDKTTPLLHDQDEVNECKDNIYNTEKIIKILEENTSFVKNQLIYSFLLCYVLVFIPSTIPLFEISTQFFCTNNEGLELANCSFKEYCKGFLPYKNLYNKKFEHKKNILYTLKDTQYFTWINQMNLLCEDTYFFSYCIFFYFIAMIISILTSVKIVNEFERKDIILFFLRLMIFTQLILVIFPGSFTIVFSCFIYGICNSFIGCFLFVLLYENCKIRCSYIQIMLPLSALFQILLFSLLKNWTNLTILNLCISILLYYFSDYLSESLEYLHINRKFKAIKNLVEDENLGYNNEHVQNYLNKVKFSYLLEEEKVYNIKKKYQNGLTKYKLEKIDEEENDYRNLVCNKTVIMSIYNDEKVKSEKKYSDHDVKEENVNVKLNDNYIKIENEENFKSKDSSKKENIKKVDDNNFNEDLIEKIDFLKTIDFSELEDEIEAREIKKSKGIKIKNKPKIEYLDYQTDFSFYQYTNSSFYFNAKNSQYQVISFIIGTVIDSNLRSKRRFFAFLNLYIWISNGITFYYLLFFIPSFVYEAKYIMFLCFTVFISEILARVTCYLFLKRIKSRTIILISMLISGILLILLYMITLDNKHILTLKEFYTNAILIFAIRYLSSISNISNYIHTIEVFPIEQRLNTIFILGILFNLGASLSGFIIKIGVISILILGINCILIAIILSLFFKKL